MTTLKSTSELDASGTFNMSLLKLKDLSWEDQTKTSLHGLDTPEAPRREILLTQFAITTPYLETIMES